MNGLNSPGDLMRSNDLIDISELIHPSHPIDLNDLNDLIDPTNLSDWYLRGPFIREDRVHFPGRSVVEHRGKHRVHSFILLSHLQEYTKHQLVTAIYTV